MPSTAKGSEYTLLGPNLSWLGVFGVGWMEERSDTTNSAKLKMELRLGGGVHRRKITRM
jgi:hypothetical protein